jgi:hypothetical protein
VDFENGPGIYKPARSRNLKKPKAPGRSPVMIVDFPKSSILIIAAVGSVW